MGITTNLADFDRWERFAEAHPEFEHNVNVGCARPNIDHGRLLTHERRAKLATLEAIIVSPRGTNFIRNRELLSPRRIYRRTNSVRSAAIADVLHGLVRDWVEAGYPVPSQREGLPARTVYKTAFGSANIYLVIAENGGSK